MIDGVLLGSFLSALCLLLGVGVAEFYHARQDTRDGQWANMLQQQQAQIADLIDYIADHSDGDEVSAEELGYD